MLDTLSQLPAAHLAFLGLVILAFSAFGTTLSMVYAWSNRPVTGLRRKPARRADPAVRPLRTATRAG